jgi:class 3 adenylate cyclase
VHDSHGADGSSATDHPDRGADRTADRSAADNARDLGNGGHADLPRDVLLLERQIEAINRFPDQNPNPVLRIRPDGHLLYANPASAAILDAIAVAVGGHLPAELRDRLLLAASDERTDPIEIQTRDWRTFAIRPVRVDEFDVINLYGTDVTAAKVIDKFPGANPNPVIRMSEKGRLVYANAASEGLTRALACTIGQPLPRQLVARIRAVADGATDQIEIQSEGHTYALTPVRVPEFGFINVYGTDVTALKAIDKFPDQNPNPVMRLSRDGVFLYANPASRPLAAALEARVGEPLREPIRTELLARLEPGANDTIELEAEGRTYSILVRSVFEFGFVNLYGTDITAARAVEQANAENERLLLNILPAPIADRLRRGERLIADRFDEITLLFADIVGFTELSSRMSAGEVVTVLNEMFSLFDGLVDRHGLEKIKTIGDAYMVVGGLPRDDGAAGPTGGGALAHGQVAEVAEMALDLIAEVARLPTARQYGIEFRVGMHTGPAVAGVIGVRRFIYDVWGDTVNTASRMEAHGIPGRVHVTDAVRDYLMDDFELEPRGEVLVRGKGPMSTWFLVGRLPTKIGQP